MKIFKSVDSKFEEIGFKKVREDKFGATYERFIEKFNYTHTIDLVHKSDGRHRIMSYDANLRDVNGIGNTGVGLTMYETELCLKKMKSLGWKVRKGV